jgi:tetratricopeptide (TPR) repeat protein
VERPALKLVTDGGGEARVPPWAAASGAAVLVAAAVAIGAGALGARAPFDPRSIAEEAVARAWGERDPGAVAEAMRSLDLRLRRFPRDAATRTIRASLLLDTSDGPAARDEALGEVRRAIADDPQAIGVRRAAARIEVGCGLWDVALADLRRIFVLEPGAGAAALSDVEPLLPDGRLDQAIPDDPAAWRAWSVRLRERGRDAEADARLAAALVRWPDDLVSRTIAASVAAGRSDPAALARLVPPGLAVPESRENALLIAFRARTRAGAGDLAGARGDARRAVALADGDPWVAVAAGDAMEQSDPALSRDWWTRSLFALGDQPARVWVLARLARLDERDGHASDAVRRWREVLALRPGEGEAARRLAALGATGQQPS